MLLVFAVLAAVVVLLWLAPDARTMVVGGFTLAMYLSFFVNLLRRWLHRNLAVGVVFLGLFAVVLLAFFTLVPALIDQLRGAITDLSSSQTSIRDALARLMQPLVDRGIIDASADEVAERMSAGITDNLAAILGWLLDALLALLSGIARFGFITFGVVLVALYLLVDTDRYQNLFVFLFPGHYRRDARELWENLAQGISHYLGGLAISMADQGILVALMLWILDVPYPLVFGLWMAVTAIIPYIGAWLAAVPAVIVAFVEHGFWTAVIVAIGYIAINTFDGKVVQPLVFGAVLKIPAIVIFLGVIIGGQVAGPLGAILAVPVAAMIRIAIDFLSLRLRVEGERGAPDEAQTPTVYPRVNRSEEPRP
jgi:predicted PurR-regulated permease PerM